MSIELYFLTQ